MNACVFVRSVYICRDCICHQISIDLKKHHLTFLPSRNLTFPSIIQLLSTIVKVHCFQVFFSLPCSNTLYSQASVMRHYSEPVKRFCTVRRVTLGFLTKTDGKTRILNTNHTIKSILHTISSKLLPS